jgi:hypothetical protein
MARELDPPCGLAMENPNAELKNMPFMGTLFNHCMSETNYMYCQWSEPAQDSFFPSKLTCIWHNCLPGLGTKLEPKLPRYVCTNCRSTHFERTMVSG